MGQNGTNKSDFQTSERAFFRCTMLAAPMLIHSQKLLDVREAWWHCVGLTSVE
jgi:hypothetical protein